MVLRVFLLLLAARGGSGLKSQGFNTGEERTSFDDLGACALSAESARILDQWLQHPQSVDLSDPVNQLEISCAAESLGSRGAGWRRAGRSGRVVCVGGSRRVARAGQGDASTATSSADWRWGGHWRNRWTEGWSHGSPGVRHRALRRRIGPPRPQAQLLRFPRNHRGAALVREGTDEALPSAGNAASPCAYFQLPCTAFYCFLLTSTGFC
jgi:hypothetical protein